MPLHTFTVPRPPDAWLVTREYGVPSSGIESPMVVGVFASPEDPDLLALVRENRADRNGAVNVVLDHPSLNVCHYGIHICNSSWLTARDIWFQRYEPILEKHLRDPRVAQVFTFKRGRLSDPLATHKSAGAEVFPYPCSASVPLCGLCGKLLSFFGVLDFRECRAMRVPRGSLVLHICKECGVVPDQAAWSIHWIREGDEFKVLGDRGQEVYVGRCWNATEYPTPAHYANDLVSEGPFLGEYSIYDNFSCFADKIGGHVFWIQGDDTPTDSRGQPMSYIGQFVGTPEIEIGDTGIIYLFYSQARAETTMTVQCF